MRNIVLLALCIATLLTLAACEEDVAAPSGAGGPYSVYGILNPRLDTQTLSVSPVQDLLEPLGSSIDAVVTSTDLMTGQAYTWTDSVVTHETGQLDHIYLANFRPDFDSRHRIMVTRSDGTSSTGEAYVPPLVMIEEEDTGTRYLSVTIRGERFRLIRIDVVYVVRRFNAAIHEQPAGPIATYSFPYTGNVVTVDDGRRLTVDLASHYDRIYSLYAIDHGLWDPKVAYICERLALDGVAISLTVGSEDWNPPGGEFDPNVLVQPGTMENVENGFGFVGGGYNEEQFLYPSKEAVENTWFYDFIGERTPEITDCVVFFG